MSPTPSQPSSFPSDGSPTPSRSSTSWPSPTSSTSSTDSTALPPASRPSPAPQCSICPTRPTRLTPLCLPASSPAAAWAFCATTSTRHRSSWATAARTCWAFCSASSRCWVSTASRRPRPSLCRSSLPACPSSTRLPPSCAVVAAIRPFLRPTLATSNTGLSSRASTRSRPRS